MPRAFEWCVMTQKKIFRLSSIALLPHYHGRNQRPWGEPHCRLPMKMSFVPPSTSCTEQIINDIKVLHRYCHIKGVPTVALPIPESRFVTEQKQSPAALIRLQVNKLLQQWAATKPDKCDWLLVIFHQFYSPSSQDAVS